MPEKLSDEERAKRSSRAASIETVGLLVIAVLLAMMLLLRWGGNITWSAR
ncbi:MAG: hypothetical protein AB7O65_12235 [Candidatus Korobacteraceae bacterium]